jgi:hypothetical protein
VRHELDAGRGDFTFGGIITVNNDQVSHKKVQI